MKDSFGGVFMIKLFLIFIIIYVGFIAMALNYAKAFKAKNLIIDYIEINEIIDLKDFRNGSQFDKLIGDILNVYNIEDSKMCSKINRTSDNVYGYEDKLVYCNDVGFMIVQSGDSSRTGGVYYTVSTYVNWNLPFLSVLKQNGSVDDINDIKGTWKITGETRVVVREQRKE